MASAVAQNKILTEWKINLKNRCDEGGREKRDRKENPFQNQSERNKII